MRQPKRTGWSIPLLALGAGLLVLPGNGTDVASSILARYAPNLVALAGLLGFWKLIHSWRPKCQSLFFGVPGAGLGTFAFWIIWSEPLHVAGGMAACLTGTLLGVIQALGISLIRASLRSVWWGWRVHWRLGRRMLRAMMPALAGRGLGKYESAIVVPNPSATEGSAAHPPFYVITLIHGTFDPDALWTKPQSQLRKKIGDKVGNAVFSVFNWTGDNSQSARLEAGERLKVHLASLIETHPGAIHFLIAHSHGGNVALYALRDERLASRVVGVITMGTPFLSVHRREIAAVSRLLAVVLALTSIALVVVALELTTVGYLRSESAQDSKWTTALNVGVFYVLPAILGGCIPLIWIGYRRLYKDRLLKWALKRQNEIVVKFSTPKFGCFKLLCAYVSFDEASFVLRFFRSPGHILNVAFAFVANLLRILWRTTIIMVILGWLVDLRHGSRSDIAGSALGYGFSAMTFLVLAILLIRLLMRTIAPALRGHRWAYGREQVSESLLVDVRPTITPQLNECELDQLAVPLRR